MATLQQKLADIQALSGFDGMDYTLFRTKTDKLRIAVVEYWLAVSGNGSTAPNLKVFIVKNFGEVNETAKETSKVPFSVSNTRTVGQIA